MTRISSLIFIIFITSSLCMFGQVSEKQKSDKTEISDNHWLISIGGGIAFQQALPSYSIVSPNLNNISAYNRSPYLFGKIAYKFQNKHQAAFILEKTVATNSFTFLGNYNEGLGVNREIDYLITNLEYSYNLFHSKRFWFGPSIQLGVGFGNENSSDFFDRGKEANFNTPEFISYHKYEITQHRIPSHIYNIGIGTNFAMEVINSRFTIGLELRWLYSFNAVHEYEINYQYNEEVLDFKVTSPLSNINLGVTLGYLF